jgi:hypothetical protein
MIGPAIPARTATARPNGSGHFGHDGVPEDTVTSSVGETALVTGVVPCADGPEGAFTPPGVELPPLELDPPDAVEVEVGFEAGVAVSSAEIAEFACARRGLVSGA